MNHQATILLMPKLTFLTFDSNLSIQIDCQYQENQNTLFIMGRPSLENNSSPFEDTIEICKKHLAEHDRLKLFFYMKSFHKDALKSLFKLLQVLNLAHCENKKITAVWLCDWDKDDLIATGKDLAEMNDFHFHVYPI